MAVFHDEVEIEDFEFDEELQHYTFPCPCGDQFVITKQSQQRQKKRISKGHLKEELEAGEDVATCPSCSLIVRVIYDPDDFVLTETVTVKAKPAPVLTN